MFIVGGILTITMMILLYACVKKDMKISKEWNEIFKEGNRDD